MQFLAEDDENIWLHLGSQETGKISMYPLLFESKATYTDPNSENLPEDSYDSEDDLDEDESTESDIIE